MWDPESVADLKLLSLHGAINGMGLICPSSQDGKTNHADPHVNPDSVLVTHSQMSPRYIWGQRQGQAMWAMLWLGRR